ncbi:MAG: fibronectin type III domain-containing protein [Nitrospirae bacterium]|nr:fibronectin type III domain-containing protein [Nitrospirota bacterium]
MLLARVESGLSTYTIQYSYDPVGNRTIETSNDGDTNYTYSANKLTSSSGVKSYAFSYDNNGNTVSENQKTYTYNQNQRLIKAVKTDTDTGTDTVLGEYTYNGNGQRVKKIANNRTTYFIYDQNGNLIEEADENGKVNSAYIYLGSIPITRVDEWWEGIKTPQTPEGVAVTPGDTQLTVSWTPDTDTVIDGYKIYWGTESGNYTNSKNVGNVNSYTLTGLTNGMTYYISITAYADIEDTYFYHTDHLDTPILMTDKNGEKVWEGEFLPFGEEYFITGTVNNNLRFPGQYYDKETGLCRNGQRDYNNIIGRYLEKDPSGLQGGTNHLYLYVGNNPLSSIDPSGTKTWNVR